MIKMRVGCIGFLCSPPITAKKYPVYAQTRPFLARKRRKMKRQ